MTNVINSATSMSTARTTLMRMFIFEASNMFERRLGRKPVLPLILDAGYWMSVIGHPVSRILHLGSCLLNLFPNCVQLLQTRVAEFPAARPQSIFHFVKTRDEFTGRSLKQTLSL